MSFSKNRYLHTHKAALNIGRHTRLCGVMAVVLLLPLLLTGCKDDFDPNGTQQPSATGHYLYASQRSFEHYSSGGNGAFSVECYNTKWKFNNPHEHLTLTPISGNTSETVNYELASHDDAKAERVSVFWLEDNEDDLQYSQAMTMSQSKASARANFVDAPGEFPATAGTYELKVDANCDWTVEFEGDYSYAIDDYQNWATVEGDVNKGLVKLTLNENVNQYSRSGYLKLRKSDNNVIKQQIRQLKPQINTSEVMLECGIAGGIFALDIESDVHWLCEFPYFGGLNPWLNFAGDNVSTDGTQAYGDPGTSQLFLEIAPNPTAYSRSTTVYISTTNLSYGKNLLAIEVKQDGGYLKWGDNIKEYDYHEQPVEFHIDSNVAWSVETYPDWITFETEKGRLFPEGVGKGTIRGTLQLNPNTYNRNGSIRLDNGNSIGITQKGQSFTTSTKLLTFSDLGGTLPVEIEGNANWYIENGVNWLTVTPEQGTDSGTIMVTAEENTEEEERGWAIDVHYADTEDSHYTRISVEQNARFMTVSTQALDFTSLPGEASVEVKCSREWSATVPGNPDWLHIGKYDGGELMVWVDDNPSVNARSAAVEIHADGLQDVRLLVSQAARYLNVDVTSVLFFAKGGQSEKITVQTDGEWKTRKEGDWFELKRATDNSFYITAGRNETDQTREGTLWISLTDLKEGTYEIGIPIVQIAPGATFTTTSFGSDFDWDSHGSHTVTVTPGGFGDKDSDWSGQGGCKITVTPVGFATDKDWNATLGHSLKVNATGYSADKDWNAKNGYSQQVTVDSYGADKAWNHGGTTTITGKVGTFKADKDWNPAGTTTVNGKTVPFKDDKDWNAHPDNQTKVKVNSYGPESNWN